MARCSGYRAGAAWSHLVRVRVRNRGRDRVRVRGRGRGRGRGKGRGRGRRSAPKSCRLMFSLYVSGLQPKM